MGTCMCMCACAFACAWPHVHVRMGMGTCVCMRMCICICICVREHVRTFLSCQFEDDIDLPFEDDIDLPRKKLRIDAKKANRREEGDCEPPRMALGCSDAAHSMATVVAALDRLGHSAHQRVFVCVVQNRASCCCRGRPRECNQVLNLWSPSTCM